jgi:hypothetical protein
VIESSDGLSAAKPFMPIDRVPLLGFAALNPSDDLVRKARK